MDVEERWDVRVRNGRVLDALFAMDNADDLAPRWWSVRDIADKMAVSKSRSLYELLDSMRQEGLIEFQARTCPNGVTGYLYRLALDTM